MRIKDMIAEDEATLKYFNNFSPVLLQKQMRI